MFPRHHKPRPLTGRPCWLSVGVMSSRYSTADKFTSCCLWSFDQASNILQLFLSALKLLLAPIFITVCRLKDVQPSDTFSNERTVYCQRSCSSCFLFGSSERVTNRDAVTVYLSLLQLLAAVSVIALHFMKND